MKREEITIKNLFSSIILLIIGVLLLTNSSGVINILAWIMGGVFVLIGIVKLITYIKTKKDYPDYEPTDLIISILSILLGIVLAFVPSIIDIAIRLVFGGWILIGGINRLILGITIKNVDNSGFKLYLITSLIMVLVGLFVLFNLFGIIGVYLIIYSVIDLVGYIYSTSKQKIIPKIEKKAKIKNKAEKKEVKSKTIKKSQTKNKKVKKSVKEKKAIDAEIAE